MNLLKLERKQLEEERAAATARLSAIDNRLGEIEILEKPFEARVTGYSGTTIARFASRDKGEAKFREYKGKQYFRNGLVYAVWLMEHKPNGEIHLLEEFVPNDRMARLPAGVIRV